MSEQPEEPGTDVVPTDPPADPPVDPVVIAPGHELETEDGGKAVVFNAETDENGNDLGTFTLQCVSPDNTLYWVNNFDPTVTPVAPAQDVTVIVEES